ncbi:MAG TPA: hypothetical protein VKI65_07045 [Gemmataceae bacterium]|nr:hypothetical protein [Gemmataceae bacterium]
MQIEVEPVGSRFAAGRPVERYGSLAALFEKQANHLAVESSQQSIMVIDARLLDSEAERL